MHAHKMIALIALTALFALGLAAGCNPKKKAGGPAPTTAPSGPKPATRQATADAGDAEKPEALNPEDRKRWTEARDYWDAFTTQRIQQMEAMARLKVPDFQADTLLEKSPGGTNLWAVLISREEPTPESRWILLVQNAVTGTVLQVYDFLRAFRVAKPFWTPDGRRFLVHELCHDQALDVGRLWEVDTTNKRARLVDDFVTAYTLAPNGVDLVYEKASSAEKPFWPRVLMRTTLAPLEQIVVRPLATLKYPADQLGGFKGWTEREGARPTLRVVLHKYPKDGLEPEVVEKVYDPSTRELK